MSFQFTVKFNFLDNVLGLDYFLVVEAEHKVVFHFFPTLGFDQLIGLLIFDNKTFY